MPLTCVECGVEFEFYVLYGAKHECYCLGCGKPVCDNCRLEYKHSDWKSWLEIRFRCSKCFQEYLTGRGLTQEQINLLEEGPKDFDRATYLTNLGHTPEIFNTPRLEDFDLASFPRRMTMTYESDEAGHYLVWEEGDKAVIIKWDETSACGLSFKNGAMWKPVGQHHNIDWHFASLELTLACLKDAGWQITIQGLPKDRPRYTDSLAKEFGYTEIVYPAPGTRSSEEFRKPPLRFRDKIDWLNTH
ncbi:MAG: hypothetical protein ACE5OZ_10430 [Candidatus Heimdallarchaeota archaeon]